MSILFLKKSAADVSSEDVAPCILLYGPSGSGKTHTAVAGGKPFVLLMERNGLTTILQANPHADYVLVEDRLELDAQGIPVKDAAGNHVTVKALDVVRMTIAAAKSGELTRAGYDRLVIDSETELQRMFKDEIVAAKGEIPDGEDAFALRDWNTLTEKMRKFHRTLRALPMPVICTALVEEVVDKEGTINVRPSFEGKKTAGEVAQYFSGVGLTVKRTKTEGEGEAAQQVAVYRTMFDGHTRYMTKSCRPTLHGVMEPDVVGWLKGLSKPALSQVEKAALAAGQPK